jgi:hypothetical protein
MSRPGVVSPVTRRRRHHEVRGFVRPTTGYRAGVDSVFRMTVNCAASVAFMTSAPGSRRG